MNLKLYTIFSSQVSPELYGDSRPRLFTYWTVSCLLLNYPSIILCIILLDIKLYLYLYIEYKTIDR